MTQAQLDALLAHITTDGAYAALILPAWNHSAIAVELNVTKSPQPSVPESTLEGGVILANLDSAEVGAQPGGTMAWLAGILAGQSFDVTPGSAARARLDQLFNATDWSVSRPTLLGILDRTTATDFEVFLLRGGVIATAGDAAVIQRDGV